MRCFGSENMQRLYMIRTKMERCIFFEDIDRWHKWHTVATRLPPRVVAHWWHTESLFILLL